MEHKPREDDRARFLSLRTEGGGDADDEELRAFLDKDEIVGPQLRGMQAPIRPGALGGPSEVLAVAFEHGPVAAALATALVGFLKYRTSDISISVVRRDGTEVNASAFRVGRRASAELERVMADAVQQAVAADPPPAPAGDG
jgi:hypothetical protein